MRLFIAALLVAISYAQTGWKVISEESSNFCDGDRTHSVWNGLGFQDSLTGCAEACINFEGCTFAAWRTDSGRGQCNGYFSCEPTPNGSSNPENRLRRWIIIEVVVVPTDIPVDCVLDIALSAATCISDCGTVAGVGSPSAAHGGEVCSTYECQPGDGDCPVPAPVNCVLNVALSAATCTSTCGTVAGVGIPSAANGGEECPTYECQFGDGTCEDESTLTAHEQLKMMVKDAFNRVKFLQTRNALPGLIRKAFHDAGHFDKNSGEMRMGCIQHFLSGSNACPQHANLEEAESFLNAVMDQIPSGLLSMADAVQLLGALAIDELAQGTNAPLLYDRVRTGRIDPQASECTDNKEMCNNLPAFFTRHHAVDDHDDIVVSLNDVWVKEIDGKMIDVNSLSKQDAVALIGAHTVGRHFEFGHWVQQPNIFDNEYFLQLKRVKDWLDSGNKLGNELGHPFDDVRSNWFIDLETVADTNAPFAGGRIMMMDSDLALVLNAPALVEKYAADLMAWRQDFDNAYIVMSELGASQSLEPPLDGASRRRLLNRAEELLDEDFEFFQNLQIHREEQIDEIHAAFRRKM